MYFMLLESGCIVLTVNVHAFCAFGLILYFVTGIYMFLKTLGLSY